MDAIKNFFHKYFNDKVKEIGFFCFLFVALLFSIVGIIVSLASNKYNSAIFVDEFDSNPAKKDISSVNEDSNVGMGFMFDSSDRNKVDPNQNIQKPMELENKEDLTSKDFITITCTIRVDGNINVNEDTSKDYKKHIKSRIYDEITARFYKETKTFADADVKFVIHSLEKDYNDLSELQDTYRRQLNYYAQLFGVPDYNRKIVFSDPDKAYLYMKELNYETYYNGYLKVTPTYQSFFSTFTSGGYTCE